jgi:hypothetical protein
MEMVGSHLQMFTICRFGSRTFYISKIIEFKKEEQKQHDTAMKKAKSKR